MKIAALVVLAVAIAAAAVARGGSPGPYAVQSSGRSAIVYRQPVEDQGYECGRLTVPAGIWRLSYRVMVYSSRPPADTGTVSAFAELHSLTDPSWFIPDMATGGRVGGNSYRAIFTLAAEKVVRLQARKTFLLVVYQSEGGNWDTLQCLGDRSTTIIRAERVG